MEAVTPSFRMSFNHGLLRPAPLLFGAMLWTGGVLQGRATDWQTILGASPFGPSVTAATQANTGVEFRGVVQEGNICLVNLYQSAAKASYWIPVGDEAAGLLVRSYDEVTGRVSVVQGGRLLVLPLKQFRVALLGDNVPLKLLGPAERVSESEAPHMPDFMRELPPEARKLLEETRRRRAIRWPALSTAGDKPATSP